MCLSIWKPETAIGQCALPLTGDAMRQTRRMLDLQIGHKDSHPNWVFASHVRGVRELRITLTQASEQDVPEKYRVRLFFATAANGRTLPNVNRMRLQGRDITSNCRVDRRSTGFICKLDAIEIGSELSLTLGTSAQDVPSPALCGIELVHEGLINP